MGDKFKTEKKIEIQKLAPGGEVETYYRIYATSAGGTYFHVDVREDDLDQADKLLSARAEELDAI